MTPLSLCTILTFLALSSATQATAHKSPHRRNNAPHDKVRKNRSTIVEEDEYVPVNNHTLGERGDTYTGVGTYYYTGLGACGQTSSDSDLMIAMNSDQYGSGYPGPQCFKYLTIEGNGVTVSGVEVLDECPTCAYGSLDMSPGLFTHFAGTDAGTVAITWWFEDGSGSSTTSTTPTSTYTPTTTSQYVAPSSSSTSQWQAPSSSSSSTSQWVAPSSSSATPSSTSQWSQPVVTDSSTSSSSTTSTSTSSAAWSTITSSSSSWSSVANSTTVYSTAANTTNSFAVVASDSASVGVAVTASISTGSNSTAASGSAGTSASSSDESADNLVNFNALVAQYGQLVVKAASA